MAAASSFKFIYTEFLVDSTSDSALSSFCLRPLISEKSLKLSYLKFANFYSNPLDDSLKLVLSFSSSSLLA